MPPQNVAVPLGEFLQRTSRHRQVIVGLGGIAIGLQKLVAELVMMRLFDDFQEAIAGVAFRLACGTPYADGTAPVLLTTPAKSTSSARDLYENHDRTKPQRVKWSKVTFINDTTRHVLDPGNPFVLACNANATIISEMQAVRNRIAHANANSRSAFSLVVQRRYGARLNNVSPGMLLLTSRFTPTLLEQYVGTCRAIIRSCARA